MLLAVLVFVMFVGGTAVLAKKTGGGGLGRSSKGRLGRTSKSRSSSKGRVGGGSKSRGFGKGRAGGTSKSGGLGRGRGGGSSRSSRFGGGRTGGTSRSGGLGRRSSSGSSTWGSKAWKSAGLPHMTRAKFSDASAAATGKTARAAARGSWWTTKKVGKTGRWAVATTLIPFDKWLARKQAGLETAAALPERPASTTPDQPKPARTVPPVFVKNPTKGETPVKTPSNFGGATNAGAPPTLAPHIDHISGFHPENDAELLDLLRQEVAGQHALAESMQQMFENCVSDKGLDPAAMQGVSEYADSFAENAENAQRAHQQFLAVYEAIIEAANNGTVMPYNGRFFSGEAAA